MIPKGCGAWLICGAHFKMNFKPRSATRLSKGATEVAKRYDDKDDDVDNDDEDMSAAECACSSV